jgi:hypothetical protein
MDLLSFCNNKRMRLPATTRLSPRLQCRLLSTSSKQFNGGGLTEEQYREQYRENWNTLMRELDPNHPDLQTPTQPEQRRRSRLL